MEWRGQKAATMERVLGPFDNTLAPSDYRRRDAHLPVLQGHGPLGPATLLCRILRAGGMDVCQQVYQITGTLHPLPDRFLVLALIHPVRLLPWLHQGLRHAYPECGEQRSFSSCPAVLVRACLRRRIWY